MQSNVLVDKCILCSSDILKKRLRLIPKDKNSPWICQSCYFKRPERRQYINLYRRSYRKTVKSRFIEAKNRARYRNKIWDLSFEDYCNIVSQPCYYCGATTAETGVGLDRIDNTKGYFKENVFSACGVCNESRSNHFTTDEWKFMITALKLYRTKRN